MSATAVVDLVGLSVIAGLLVCLLVMIRRAHVQLVLPPDPDERLMAIEAALVAVRQSVVDVATPPQLYPVVEVWLMDEHEETIEAVTHVATRAREPEMVVGGQLYRAAREPQPGYWIYRRVH